MVRVERNVKTKSVYRLWDKYYVTNIKNILQQQFFQATTAQANNTLKES